VPRNLTEVPQRLVPWLESSVEVIEKSDAGLYVQGEVWRIYRADGRPGTTSWTRQLQSIAWVPSKSSSTLSTPSHVTVGEANLSPRLLAALQSKGISFAGIASLQNQSEQLFSQRAVRFERLKSILPLTVADVQKAPATQQAAVLIKDGCLFMSDVDLTEPYTLAAQLANDLLLDSAPKKVIPAATLLLLEWIRGVNDESFQKAIRLVEELKL
jgi:hypothetical protein